MKGKKRRRSANSVHNLQPKAIEITEYVVKVQQNVPFRLTRFDVFLLKLFDNANGSQIGGMMTSSSTADNDPKMLMATII